MLGMDPLITSRQVNKLILVTKCWWFDYIQYLQDRITVDGIQLDVVCSNFGNRLLLVVTQLQKLGTLVRPKRDCMVIGYRDCVDNAFLFAVVAGGHVYFNGPVFTNILSHNTPWKR